MRILYVVREFPKLSETFILNEIIELLKLGHDIIILAETCRNRIIQEDVTKYNLLNRTVYSSIGYATGREKALDFLRKVITDFIKNPFETIRILFSTFKFNRDIWVFLDSYLGYRALYNKNIDLIYLTFSYPKDIDKTFFLSKVLQAPFMLNFRAYDLYERKNQKGLRARLKFIKKASKIITISDYNKKNLAEKLGVKNVDIICDSIHPEKFQPSHSKKDKKIIAVCRFVPQKGIKYLIEACKILQQRKVDYRCVIVGSGLEEKLYKKLIKKYSLSNVLFTGPLPQEQHKKELDNSTLFVLPCIITKEGNRDILANVIKEAMAMELPIVTSNICGIEELVENGINGILVPPKNPKAIADAIEKLLKNPKLRKKMGGAGREKIEKKFDIRTEIKKLEKIFFEATKSNRSKKVFETDKNEN